MPSSSSSLFIGWHRHGHQNYHRYNHCYTIIETIYRHRHLTWDNVTIARSLSSSTHIVILAIKRKHQNSPEIWPLYRRGYQLIVEYIHIITDLIKRKEENEKRICDVVITHIVCTWRRGKMKKMRWKRGRWWWRCVFACVCMCVCARSRASARACVCVICVCTRARARAQRENESLPLVRLTG